MKRVWRWLKFAGWVATVLSTLIRVWNRVNGWEDAILTGICLVAVMSMAGVYMQEEADEMRADD